jgi:alpha/beta superfamily hydrolase
LYELINHESFYVGNVEPAFEAIQATLDDVVTIEQVYQVYREEAAKQEG